MYAWRGTPRLQRLYRTAFVLASGGNALLALTDWLGRAN
jgi:hypothetical protein